MLDAENKCATLNAVWERLVALARENYQEAVDTDDAYFFGIYEGVMLSLASLAGYEGRLPEYVQLCRELEGLSWGFGG